VKVEPEVALVGGILRYRPFAKLLEEKLGCPVRVPDETLVQHVGALGAAVLGLKRLAAPARAAT
jgi:activator of 2-hydroxyglutaryl-CoA dehydratase